MTAGGPTQQEFFCIHNQGIAPDKTSATSSLALGSCPSTGNGLQFETPQGVPTSLAANMATPSPTTIGVCAGSFTTSHNKRPNVHHNGNVGASMRPSTTLLVPIFFVVLSALAFAATSLSIQNTTRINPGLLSATISAVLTKKVGHLVAFLGTCIGGIPYVYAWNFGDGTTGMGPGVTHSYNSTRVKIVICKVTDTIGSIATNQTTVTVT